MSATDAGDGGMEPGRLTGEGGGGRLQMGVLGLLSNCTSRGVTGALNDGNSTAGCVGKQEVASAAGGGGGTSSGSNSGAASEGGGGGRRSKSAAD